MHNHRTGVILSVALCAALIGACDDRNGAGDSSTNSTSGATSSSSGSPGDAASTSSGGGDTSTPDDAAANTGGDCAAAPAAREGEGTYYAATGAGNCSYPATPDDLMVAAMNNEDYAGSAICGACVEVTGPDGSARVRIVDRCPGCAPGDIDLSAEAFALIADPSAGRVPISWRPVACDAEGPIAYHFKEGSNQWWSAVQVRDHRYPIATLEFLDADSIFQNVERLNYNYFVYTPGMGPGPYTLRVTDTRGHVLVDEGVPFAEDTVARGAAQLPVCP